ncbi:MAG: Hsp70 family protein [Holosporaceae bacterium]|jgi:molecular chaperone HscA|nr:Hsp70 family protein [Holosporaceae bacterium]
MFIAGIDLGTTASVISCVKDGVPTAISVGGHTVTPSAVNYSEERPLVGRKALYKFDSDRTVLSVKRFTGANVKFCGRSPVEVSADILFYLKKNAEESLGMPMKSAVITVPAHFSDSQRTAVKQAASVAGIKVLRLINEPTAAAVAFGLDKRKEGIFGVYDFGGGTFDFSVLRLTGNGIFQVLATGGDNRLGGDDLDDAILEYNLRLCGLDADCIGENEKKNGRMTAKFLKEISGSSPEVQADYFRRGKKYEFKLSRAIIEELSRNLLQRTMNIAEQVISDSGVEKLNGVVAIGGMTRLKVVKDAMRRRFNCRIFDEINPEEAVSLGAAAYADSLIKKSGNLLLIDVVPLTLGIETFGGGIDKIIYRNTPIPIVEKREYTTGKDNQTGMTFHVVQGERPLAEECRSLAKFELSGIPPMPAGRARVVVEFSADVNGLLNVRAFEKRTGVEQTITVDPSSGLSREEMTSILQKASEKLSEDSLVKRNINLKIESERMIGFWEAVLDKLPPVERKNAETETANLKEALKKENYEDAINYKKNLEAIFSPFWDDIISSRLSGRSIGEIGQ